MIEEELGIQTEDGDYMEAVSNRSPWLPGIVRLALPE
jgi:hypothetical protein